MTSKPTSRQGQAPGDMAAPPPVPPALAGQLPRLLSYARTDVSDLAKAVPTAVRELKSVRERAAEAHPHDPQARIACEQALAAAALRRLRETLEASPFSGPTPPELVTLVGQLREAGFVPPDNDVPPSVPPENVDGQAAEDRTPAGEPGVRSRPHGRTGKRPGERA